MHGLTVMPCCEFGTVGLSRRSRFLSHGLDDLDGLLVGRKQHLQRQFGKRHVGRRAENRGRVQKGRGAEAGSDPQRRGETLRPLAVRRLAPPPGAG